MKNNILFYYGNDTFYLRNRLDAFFSFFDIIEK